MNLCECGCGQIVNKRFVRGHNLKVYHSSKYAKGISFDRGRIMILVRGDKKHPRSIGYGYVYRHILIAEKALGKSILRPIVVHHIDGDKTNDDNSNLVICENQAYHVLLHKRTNAYAACGHANWEKCQFCKEYDDPNNMYVNGRKSYHKECRRIFNNAITSKD